MSRIHRVVVEIVADGPMTEREATHLVRRVLDAGLESEWVISMLSKRHVRRSPVRTKQYAHVRAADRRRTGEERELGDLLVAAMRASPALTTTLQSVVERAQGYK